MDKDTLAFVDRFVSDFFEVLPDHYGRGISVQRDLANALAVAVKHAMDTYEPTPPLPHSGVIDEQRH